MNHHVSNASSKGFVLKRGPPRLVSHMTCTLSNSPGCKRQLSRRHLLADSGIGQIHQRRKPLERFAVLRFCRFQPNARLQSDVLDIVVKVVGVNPVLTVDDLRPAELDIHLQSTISRRTILSQA
jgi:hypothetical protein